MENNEKKTNENTTVDVVYQGSIYIITMEEYKELMEGYRTLKEMFG